MLTPSLSSSAWSLTERSPTKLFMQVQIPAQKYFSSTLASCQRQSWCGWKNNSLGGRKLKLDSSFLIHNRYYLLTSNSEGCLNRACEFHSRNSVYLFVLKQKTPFLITRIQNTVISQVMFALLLKQLTFIECLLYSLC